MVTEAQKETGQTEEASKPKVEDSPEFKEALQRAIRQGTSKYQRSEAAAKKQSAAMASQLEAIQTELAKAREDAEVARFAGDDIDAAERVRRIQQREQAAEKRWKEAESHHAMGQAVLREAMIQTLHTQYGIPTDDLEEYETAPEMEIAALKYEREQSKKGAPKATAKESELEERESKPLDTADGRLGSIKIPPPGTKEFEEFYSRVKANFSR